jgi:vitamin B12 transporter
LLGVGLLLLCSPTASAQTQLPGIYVQGATLEKKSPRPAPGPKASDEQPAGGETTDGDTADGVPAGTVGNAITVITRQDLERQQVRHVADALRGVAGLAVSRSGAFGNFTQVRIRGAEGNHTLVLIDGVEANSATDGEFDFSNLAAEDIERIEVIRGPMSALYGSGAVGGVINIITRRGQGPLTLTLKSELGTLGTSDFAARLAAGSPWAHFALGAHWRNTDGFNISPFGSEADGSRLTSFNFRGGVKIVEGLGVEVHLRQSNKIADRDGTDFTGPLLIPVDDASTQHDRVFVGGVQLRWDTLNNALTHQLHYKYNTATILDRDVVLGNFENIGERTSYGYLATYRFESPALWALKHTLSGLIERETEAFTPVTADNIKRERDRLAFAVEWRGAFADQVFITAGVRHDDNSVFSDFTTWRLSGAWALKSLGLRPHASLGTAVKFPQMFEQFGAFPLFFVANPDLQPEESFGWDVGIEWTLNKKTVLDLTYFHADLTNKIGQRTEPCTPPAICPTLVNLPGLSTRDGLELALRTRWTEALSATFAYTYLLAEDSDGGQEIRRPRHAGRVDLAYTFAQGKGSANLGVVYNGTMTDSAFDAAFNPVTVLLDEYWLARAAVSYKLQRGVEAFARVENLFDQRYQEVFGFEAAPITAFAGLKLTFGGPDGVVGEK